MPYKGGILVEIASISNENINSFRKYGLESVINGCFIIIQD